VVYVSGGSRYAPEVKHEGPEPSFTEGRRSVIKPSKTEVAENARSRSAKLRFAIRTEAAPFPMDDELLPRVAQLTDVAGAA